MRSFSHLCWFYRLICQCIGDFIQATLNVQSRHHFDEEIETLANSDLVDVQMCGAVWKLKYPGHRRPPFLACKNIILIYFHLCEWWLFDSFEFDAVCQCVCRFKTTRCQLKMYILCETTFRWIFRKFLNEFSLKIYLLKCHVTVQPFQTHSANK